MFINLLYSVCPKNTHLTLVYKGFEPWKVSKPKAFSHISPQRNTLKPVAFTPGKKFHFRHIPLFEP